MLRPGQVLDAIRPDDIHFPRSRLLCIENPHNFGGGTVAPPALLDELCTVAHREGLAAHLDGARIFNASVALGLPVDRIAAPFDSVMFCLSKGLCAPVGSMIAGTSEWIGRARRARKMLGGGMRQAGVLAAAGLVALDTMVRRLVDDHANARRLASALAEISGLRVDPDTVQTNMVFAEVTTAGLDAAGLVDRLAGHGVLAGVVGVRRVRFVTHWGVDEADVETAIAAAAAAVR
jgi:threonine aldolase